MNALRLVLAALLLVFVQGAAAGGAASLRPFDRTTLAAIERAHRGQAFWLVLWDLECVYCMQSMQRLAAAQKRRPDLVVVTVNTDGIAAREEVLARLRRIGLRGEAYAYGEELPEALAHAIDPAWRGEKPRAYRYPAEGPRRTHVGVLREADLL